MKTIYFDVARGFPPKIFMIYHQCILQQEACKLVEALATLAST